MLCVFVCVCVVVCSVYMCVCVCTIDYQIMSDIIRFCKTLDHAPEGKY